MAYGNQCEERHIPSRGLSAVAELLDTALDSAYCPSASDIYLDVLIVGQ